MLRDNTQFIELQCPLKQKATELSALTYAFLSIHVSILTQDHLTELVQHFF